MIIPIKDKILGEVINREKVLPSGIILPDKQKLEKKDNVCRCLGVGSEVKLAKRGDIVHYKEGFCQKLTYEGKALVFIKDQDVIAIEREGHILAVGSMVIVRLEYSKLSEGGIEIPDCALQNSGEFVGEIVSAGIDFPDRLKKGDKVIYLRNEGYRFRTMAREDLLAVKSCWVYGKEA